MVVEETLIPVDVALVGAILLLKSGVDVVGSVWVVDGVTATVDVSADGNGTATLIKDTCADWVTITVVGTSAVAGAVGLVFGPGPSA